MSNRFLVLINNELFAQHVAVLKERSLTHHALLNTLDGMREDNERLRDELGGDGRKEGM